MPFNTKRFEQSVIASLGRPLPETLTEGCAAYATAKTPPARACAVRDLMMALEAEAGTEVGRTIMQRCACIGPGVIDKALALQQEAGDLEDLLARLNAVHIGGGHLRLEGDVIHAAYDHCYCSSVNQTTVPVPATYCACSCGWYGRLFEALLGQPVEVELLSSMIQGDAQCGFAIRVQTGV
jgi:hypothetical protein